MSTYVKDEIYDWVTDWMDDGRTPEDIKKDLVHTIDKVLEEALESRYKVALTDFLKEYIQMAHGEDVAKSLADEGYDKMTESVLDAVDDMMNGIKGYQKAAKEAATDTKRRTAPAPQEDKDAQIIADFLKQISNQKKSSTTVDPNQFYADDNENDWISIVNWSDHRLKY